MQEQETRTLRDYLAILRRRRLVILGICVIGAATALGLALTKEKTYTADAALRIKEVEESLSLVGLLPPQGELPAQTSAQAAATATRTTVLRRVTEELGIDVEPEDLEDDVTATQDAQSNLVTISAEAGTAEGSADLANAVAGQVVIYGNEVARDRYSKFADRLRAQAEAITVPGEELIELTPQERQEVADDLARRKSLLDDAAALQSLSTVAETAEVTDEATPPDSPTAPKPIRNTIIGGFLGLIVGLLAAALLESLDRRVRRPDEAAAMLDWPLIGSIPDHATGRVPVGGVPTEENVAALETFRILRTNLDYLDVDQPVRTALVTSPTPEEGKTTVAIGLALAGALSGRRTLLVEADLHRSVHAERLGLQARPGLTEYLNREAEPQDVVQLLEFEDPAGAKADPDGDGPNGDGPHGPRKFHLACITAGGERSTSGELFGSERFATFMSEVSQAYELVVVDTAPLLAVAETAQIVPLADCVLFCVRMARTTGEQARVGKEALERLPERPTGIVATGVTEKAAGAYSYYSYAYGYRFGEPPKSRFGRTKTKA